VADVEFRGFPITRSVFFLRVSMVRIILGLGRFV
jgi:hypothetical protein